MTALSTGAIVRLNELRHVRGACLIADESRPLADGWLTYSEGVPWITRLTGLGLERMPTPDELDRIIPFFRERSAQPRVEFPGTVSESTLQAIGKRGFSLHSVEHVLARLIDPADTRPPWTPEGVRVERVDPGDDTMIRTHATVSLAGFLPPGTRPSDGMYTMAARALRNPRTDAFIAWRDQRPIGACGMESDEINGVRLSALWGATVLPEFRRQGVQRALIEHRLAFARSRGGVLAVIESAPGIPTERHAARVGFALISSRVVLVAGE